MHQKQPIVKTRSCRESAIPVQNLHSALLSIKLTIKAVLSGLGLSSPLYNTADLHRERSYSPLLEVKVWLWNLQKLNINNVELYGCLCPQDTYVGASDRSLQFSVPFTLCTVLPHKVYHVASNGNPVCSVR